MTKIARGIQVIERNPFVKSSQKKMKINKKQKIDFIKHKKKVEILQFLLINLNQRKHLEKFKLTHQIKSNLSSF